MMELSQIYADYLLFTKEVISKRHFGLKLERIHYEMEIKKPGSFDLETERNNLFKKYIIKQE